MEQILQALVSGILLGGFYAVMVLGFSVIWGVMGVINLAHGEFVMVGAYLAWTLNRFFGIDPLLSLIVVMPAMFLVGYVLQKVLINRVVERSYLISLLVTFGLSIAIANLFKLIYSADPRTVSVAYNGSFEFLGITFPIVKTIIFCMSLVIMLALHLFLQNTRLGKSIRAAAQNKEAARIVGIEVNKVYAIVFGIGIAAAAGVMVSMTVPIFPFMGPPFTLKAFTITALGGFMFVTLASDWNLIGGMTGYVDFGHAVFFGIGAFMMGILVTQVENYIHFAPGLSYWQAIPLAGLAAALFALLIGLPTLRLKGPYFSIAMLATLVATREIIRILKPFTGGGSGLDLPPVLNRTRDFYFMLVWMGIVVSFIWWVRRSEFGQSLIAIREDEVGAEMRGINTTKHKIIVFMLAAFSTGIVGGFWAFQNTYIDPDIVFIEQRTVDMVMATILGGAGTVWGPPLGAVILYVMQDVVWSSLPQAHLLVEGIILGTLGDPSSTSLGRLWGRYVRRSPSHETQKGEDPA